MVFNAHKKGTISWPEFCRMKEKEHDEIIKDREEAEIIKEETKKKEAKK